MKRIIRFVILETLILFARLTHRIRQPGIPVFVYHSIDTTHTSIALTPSQFERHLTYLHKHNFQLITSQQAIEKTQNKQPTTKYAVLTFDDAYTTIFPYIEHLLQHGQTATLFIPTQRIGQSNLWDKERTDIVQIPIMDVQHLQKLINQGCEIGSHTQTHPNLAHIAPETCTQEIKTSREDLHKTFQIPIHHLAYPYGAYTKHVKQATQNAGYMSGFTTQLGYLTPQTDLFEIPRFPTNIPFQLFRLIVHGGYTWYRKLQDILFASSNQKSD